MDRISVLNKSVKVQTINTFVDIHPLIGSYQSYTGSIERHRERKWLTVFRWDAILSGSSQSGGVYSFSLERTTFDGVKRRVKIVTLFSRLTPGASIVHLRRQ